jgi:cell division protein FtsZ
MENSLKFELPTNHSSIIKVIGVGGGGSNAVNYMYEMGIKGVDFIVCNTDAQSLDKSPVPTKIQLGNTLTEGRGAGSIPEVGRNAAIESLSEVQALLSDKTNMVFITAGMGGGTGTGAAPVIAKAAKEMGILTVGIVTIPFMFEGRKRSTQADLGLKEMREAVDTLLVIRNDKLRELYGNLSLKQAFAHADEVLCTAAKGIAEVITLIGTVNVDMNDVNTVMKESGVAIMGSGRASGEGRAKRAIQSALESPLLNDNDINGANFILLNVTFGNEELLMDEISEITDYIQEQAGQEAEVIWGYGHDESLGDDICATVIATGFAAKTVDHALPAPSAEPKRMWLETQGAKEITQKIEKPLPHVAEEPVAEVQQPEQPFVKTIEAPIEFEFEVQNNIPQDVITQAELFSTDELPELSTMKFETQEVSALDTPSVDFTQAKASGSVEAQVDTSLSHREDVMTDRPTRSEINIRNKEREMRIKEFTIKLKTPSGLSDLEEEPAYLRRKVNLDAVKNSNESTVSRFSLNETVDENGQKRVELRDNPFLHDNVD